MSSLNARIERLTPFQFFVLVSSLIFISQLPSFFIPVLSSDEPTWTMLSRHIFSGGFYIDVSDNKPPFHFILYWLGTLGGTSLISMKIFLWLWFAVGAHLLLRVAQELQFDQERGSAQGRWAALLFALACAYSNNGAVSGEKLLLVPLLASFYAALKSKHGDKIIWAFLSGVFFAAAVNIKPTATLFAPFAFILAALASLKKTFLSTIGKFIAQILGGLVFTYFCWRLIQVPFETIYQEAVALGFQYSGNVTQWDSDAINDLLGNLFLMLGVWYLPLLILTAIGFHSAPRKFILPLSLFLASAFAAVSVGFRFYQQYFPLLLPALCLPAALGMNKLAPRRQSYYLILISLMLVAHHAITVTRQVQSKNRNWNPLVVEAISDVREITQPGDSIWLTGSLYSMYVYNDLNPASKYQLWLYYFGMQDSCRAHADSFTEEKANQNYDDLVTQLTNKKPKVIYWTSRHENNCSDQFKIENFPRLKNFIETNYKLKKHNEQGYLYLLRKE